MKSKEDRLQLLQRIRFEDLPKIHKTTVFINGFKSMERDLIENYQSTFPEIESLWDVDKNWKFGTDLVMFWRERRFQISLNLTNREIARADNQDLEMLGFLDRSENNQSEFVPVETGDGFWNKLKEQLSESENEAFLHLEIGFSLDRYVRWSEHWKLQKDYAKEIARSEKYFHLMHESREGMDGIRDYCFELGKQFFPRRMFVLDACLTNIPTNMIWQYSGRKI